MSDAQWLKDAPSNWTISPAWAVFGERGQKSTAADVHLTPSQQFAVIAQEQYMEITGNRVVLNLTGSDNMKAVRHGDFVIHLRSFQGGIEASSLDGKVSTAYTVLRPAMRLHSSYYRHLFKSKILIEQLENLTDQLRDGQTINYARFARMTLPVPPIDVQERIADYLDRETGEIDAMIGKLDEMARALEMRRVATLDAALHGRQMTTIDHAWSVTDCLHKTAKSVDSGDNFVVSIGQLDAHSVDVSTSLRTTDEDFAAMRDGGRTPAPGDVIMSRNASVGKVAVVTEQTPQFAMGQDVVLLHPREYASAALLSYTISSSYGQEALGLAMLGTTFKRINVAAIKKLPWPHLSQAEQIRIADHLDEVTGKIDAMLAKVAELKSLLIERRAALITDVVTGKKEIA